MAIDERLRLSIHAKFTEMLGQEEADALISHIMPVPWHDVATKDDLRVLSAELRAEIGDLRTELKGDISELRAEFNGLRAEFAELRGEVRGDIGELRGEIGNLRGELHAAIVGQTRWLMGYVTALSIAILTVSRLLF